MKGGATTIYEEPESSPESGDDTARFARATAAKARASKTMSTGIESVQTVGRKLQAVVSKSGEDAKQSERFLSSIRQKFPGISIPPIRMPRKMNTPTGPLDGAAVDKAADAETKTDESIIAAFEELGRQAPAVKLTPKEESKAKKLLRDAIERRKQVKGIRTRLEEHRDMKMEKREALFSQKLAKEAAAAASKAMTEMEDNESESTLMTLSDASEVKDGEFAKFLRDENQKMPGLKR